MMLLRILFIGFLLGIGTHSANACVGMLGAHEPAHIVATFALGSVHGDVAAIGTEQRCECPSVMSNAALAVSESSKPLLAPYVESTEASPYPSNFDAAAVAMRSCASSYIARRSELAPYLLLPRLLQ